MTNYELFNILKNDIQQNNIRPIKIELMDTESNTAIVKDIETICVCCPENTLKIGAFTSSEERIVLKT